MSRPRWSEPSQCSAEGAASVLAASVAMGSCVASTSAKIAVRTITAISSPPAAPSGLRRMKRHSVVPKPWPGRAAAGTVSSISAPTGLTAIADPRVEDAVEHVDEQVREDHHDRDEHHEVLHD